MGNICTKDTPDEDFQQPTPQDSPAMRPAVVADDHSPPARQPLDNDLTPTNNAQADEVKIDEHALARDYEKVVDLNPMAPAVKKAFEKHGGARNFRAFPELADELSAHQVDKLRNRNTGDTYHGHVVRGVPHGWGMFVTKTGEMLEGVFVEGHPHSHLRQIQLDGTLYLGEFKNHKRHGKGSLITPDGIKQRCDTWVNGHVHGKYFEIDTNNQQERLLFEGARNEKGLDGDVYISRNNWAVQGKFKDGVAAGPLKKTYADGRVYTGPLNKDYLEEGVGRLVMIDGRIFEGPFTHGLPNGEGQFTSDTGKTSKQTWKNGKRV